MYSSWHQLSDNENAQADLITTREAALDDRVFGRRDNRTGRIDDVLAADPALLNELAEHLAASPDETRQFLEHARFTTAHAFTHAEEVAKVQLLQRNVANPEQVIREARTIVNDWIQEGLRTINPVLRAPRRGKGVSAIVSNWTPLTRTTQGRL